MAKEELFAKLRSLQDILSHKIECELNIEDIPKVLVSQEEMLVLLKKKFIDKSAEYDEARAQETELRNNLHEAEHSREGAEKNMDAIKTQREYEALDKEIRDAADKEQHYRKELLKQERRLSDLKTELGQNEAMILQQEQELAERRTKIEAEVAEKKARLAELQKQEDEVMPDLNEEILFKFDRIIRNKKGKGIVPLKSGVCLGCHMILPVQFANMVRLGEEIVFCPYCSRILYFEESEADEEYSFDLDEAGSLADLDDLEEEEEDFDEEEEDKVQIDYDE
ncbi:MAG: C4-type zinc ribbon domain-containing protein [Spirochaetaceae bacterium]|jgi:predicted  nucleic acid-binding Zn-ribbon protein|nr:C4-type zinc ribbon domain-containing protein [Spirochaetaceae bacterium]